ncbi:BRO-N domain-containing protein [Agathobaculum sp. Marseille-P7918]|uniref:BRO-N domain-containing protein n=1 Tax=Agathobaculum sp. Marseille-P7918 TaxID=2479843 RepID=UPI000F641BF7|nr:Bro-N domain-containing protein [Agathobaculum sp. Marseille-P7918]
MSKEIQIFKNEQFGQIRVLMKDGVPWFVGKDVAEVLGYTNPSKALADHVDKEDKLNNNSLSSLGQRGGWLINESGLYSLILSSKLETAKAFKHWVTAEVLPSIRKHGEYVTSQKAQQRLGEVNSAARIIRQTLKEAGMAPQFVAVAMKSLYAPVGVEIPLEGITVNKRLLDATAIAKRLGVLSRSGNPHAQAVSAIIAQVDVLPDEKEIVPFQNIASGHAGTNVQYTESVVAKVNLWLNRHGYPEEINYKGKQYVVRYGCVA